MEATSRCQFASQGAPMRNATTLAIIAATTLLVSCGAIMDTAYLLGDGKTSSVVPASVGTGVSGPSDEARLNGQGSGGSQ